MATTKWVLDPSHSEINFKVKHLMVTNVSGSFRNFSVSAETNGDDFSNARIDFSADTSSVTTNSEQRDEHLKGAEFFDVDNFPQLNFMATGLKAKGSDDLFELMGNLTIKDVTRPVKLDVEYGGIVKDPWGNTKAGFTITGKINRKDFGLNWNAMLEAGGVMVSDDVRINSEIQLIKQV